VDILMSKDNVKQPEISKSFQAKANNGLPLKIHHETIGAEKSNKKIDLRLSGRRNNVDTFLIRLADDFLRRQKRAEALQPRIICGFNRL
jgi:hypothetical protein